ncbi:MAG: M20 family metallopeptidase [bacterium]
MKSTSAEQIKHKAREQREELLKLCKKLVEFETPSNEPETLEPAFDFLQEQFHQLDFYSKRLTDSETGGHLYLRPNQREKHSPRQLLLGHVDTVWETGTLQESPFEIDEDSGRASGPGLFDMKAGIAQLIVSLKIIRDLGLNIPVQPLIFLNSDEEIGSPQSSRYISCLAKFSNRCFVLEPAMGPDGKLKTARKGVGHFTIDIEGRASHAGISPEKGSSAILELSHVIQNLNELNNPENGITINVGVIEGGTRSNVVASSSEADVDVRVKTQTQAREIEEKIRNLEPEADDVELSIEGHFRRPPMERTEQNRQLWNRVKQRGIELGFELDEAMSGGASDGNTASQHTPTLDGLGPIGDGAHETYEYIEINGLVERTALLVSLLTMPPLEENSCE